MGGQPPQDHQELTETSPSFRNRKIPHEFSDETAMASSEAGRSSSSVDTDSCGAYFTRKMDSMGNEDLTAFADDTSSSHVRASTSDCHNS